MENIITVGVECCEHCVSHSWCTRHFEEKYAQQFDELKQSLEAALPGVVVLKNQVPLQLRPLPAESDCNRYFDQERQQVVCYPRVGAFQIYAFDLLIFSKLQANVWPNPSRIIEIVKEMQLKQASGQSLNQFQLKTRLKAASEDPIFRSTYRRQIQKIKAKRKANATSTHSQSRLQQRRTQLDNSRRVRADLIKSAVQQKELPREGSEQQQFVRSAVSNFKFRLNEKSAKTKFGKMSKRRRNIMPRTLTANPGTRNYEVIDEAARQPVQEVQEEEREFSRLQNKINSQKLEIEQLYRQMLEQKSEQFEKCKREAEKAIQIEVEKTRQQRTKYQEWRLREEALLQQQADEFQEQRKLLLEEQARIQKERVKLEEDLRVAFSAIQEKNRELQLVRAQLTERESKSQERLLQQLKQKESSLRKLQEKREIQVKELETAKTQLFRFIQQQQNNYNVIEQTNLRLAEQTALLRAQLQSRKQAERDWESQLSQLTVIKKQLSQRLQQEGESIKLERELQKQSIDELNRQLDQQVQAIQKLQHKLAETLDRQEFAPVAFQIAQEEESHSYVRRASTAHFNESDSVSAKNQESSERRWLSNQDRKQLSLNGFSGEKLPSQVKDLQAANQLAGVTVEAQTCSMKQRQLEVKNAEQKPSASALTRQWVKQGMQKMQQIQAQVQLKEVKKKIPIQVPVQVPVQTPVYTLRYPIKLKLNNVRTRRLGQEAGESSSLEVMVRNRCSIAIGANQGGKNIGRGKFDVGELSCQQGQLTIPFYDLKGRMGGYIETDFKVEAVCNVSSVYSKPVVHQEQGARGSSRRNSLGSGRQPKFDKTKHSNMLFTNKQFKKQVKRLSDFQEGGRKQFKQDSSSELLQLPKAKSKAKLTKEKNQIEISSQSSNPPSSQPSQSSNSFSEVKNVEERPLSYQTVSRGESVLQDIQHLQTLNQNLAVSKSLQQQQKQRERNQDHQIVVDKPQSSLALVKAQLEQAKSYQPDQSSINCSGDEISVGPKRIRRYNSTAIFMGRKLNLAFQHSRQHDNKDQAPTLNLVMGGFRVSCDLDPHVRHLLLLRVCNSLYTKPSYLDGHVVWNEELELELKLDDLSDKLSFQLLERDASKGDSVLGLALISSSTFSQPFGTKKLPLYLKHLLVGNLDFHYIRTDL